MANAFDKFDAPSGNAFDKFDAPSKAEAATRTDKVLRGVRDPFDGAAQLFEKVMPQGFNDANRNVNNWLADKLPSVFAKMPETGVSGLIQQQEADYQSKRAAGGESGFDGYRTIGNVVSPANLAVASKLPVAASLAGKFGTGVAGGALSGALNPVVGDDFWGEKGKQVGIGAAFGGATPLLTAGAARIISPNASMNPANALLKAEGIKPTIGQTLGGWANKAEERAQSLPIVGDAIAAARNRSSEDLNRAAFNRSLAPINQKLPMDVKLGGDAVEYTRKALGGKYDELLPRMVVQKDQAYNQSLTGLKQMVNNGAISTGAPKQFNRFLANEVEPLFQGQQAMTGETFKRLQSKVTEQIQRTQASTNADERLLGDAYKELGDQLNQLSVRSNPALGKELKAINTGYANFKRVQKAAGYLGTDEGVFSAANLQGAVRAADRSKDKARFAEGNALMQDLSGAGKSVLTNKVPDSGTAGRLMLGVGGLASGAVNPLIPAGLLGGAAMYTPQMQNLLRAAASSRPQGAKAVANTFEQYAPLLIPGGAQVGLGLLN